MNNLFQGRRLKYLLYFGALVTVGSTGFYFIGENYGLLIVGIASGASEAVINPVWTIFYL